MAGVACAAALAGPGMGRAWAAAPVPPARQVVIIAVPGLLWSDLATMPALSAYAATSSIGSLVVRGQPPASRCADGSLTFAAGNRAAAGGTTSCVIDQPTRAALQTALSRGRYGADIDAFGDELQAAHVATIAYGRAAALLLADSEGRVDVQHSADPDPTQLRSDIAGVHSRAVFALLDEAGYLAGPDGRAAADRALDHLLAAQLAAVPATATTIVAGTSDDRIGGPQLRVVIVHGPGWRHVELGSPTTNGTFVQLVDLAPTVLGAFGLPEPDSMIGEPAYDTGRAAPARASLIDVNRHAVAARRVSGPLHNWFGILGLGVLVLVVVSWLLPLRPAYVTGVWLSRLGLGLPIASYLLQVGPWWRHLGWYPAMLVAIMAILAAVTAGIAVRGPTLAVVAVLGVIAVVLAIDQLVGAPLQASAPLGNLPLTAGRFHGMGNIAFACFCGAAVVCAGVAGGVLRARGRCRLAVVSVLAIGGVATVIDAAPRWGDDFGGLLTMPVCVLLLATLVAGIRITARRVAAVVVGVAVLAVVVALADYSRPPDSQTHIGRFAGEVIHGGAGRTISRKLYSADHSFGNVPITASVALLVLAMVVWHRQTGEILARVAGLREAAIAVGALAVLGSALNDSGIVIAQFALISAFLAVVGAGLADPGSAGASRRAPLAAPATSQVA